jgi:hypothetical protein
MGDREGGGGTRDEAARLARFGFAGDPGADTPPVSAKELSTQQLQRRIAAQSPERIFFTNPKSLDPKKGA